MIRTISYGDKLDKFVREQNLIPYRLHKNSRYRNNCYYWIDYYDKWLKVEEVKYDFSTPVPVLDHVICIWMDNLQAYICTDLSIWDFRLERDTLCIRDADIINSPESFAGGEIEYWMFMHNVNFIEKRYFEFAKFFDRSSPQRIDPDLFYFVKADMIKGKYTNVRFVLDKSQKKFSQPKKRNKEQIHSYTIEISKEEITRQRRRRRKRHESANNKQHNKTSVQ